MNAPHGVFAPTRRLRDKVISPASVDHGWRCTTRRAAGVDDVTGLTVAGVAEVDVGAVDVSPRLGRAACAGLQRRCPEVFALSGQDARYRLHRGARRGEDVLMLLPLPRKKILEHLGLRAEALPNLRVHAPPVTLGLFPAARITPSPSSIRSLNHVAT